MRKQRKKYIVPKNLFDTSRISSDKEIAKNYGLKNKSEIWKADAEVNRIRTEAKKLIVNPEKQETFFKKLKEMGLLKSKDAGIDDILSLTKENLLDRRLQTVVLKLGLAKTIREARQIIVHKKIIIGDHLVTIPSYIVKVSEESKIKLAKRTEKTKKEEKKEIKPEKPETKTEKIEPVKEEKAKETQEISDAEEVNAETKVGEIKNE